MALLVGLAVSAGAFALAPHVAALKANALGNALVLAVTVIGVAVSFAQAAVVFPIAGWVDQTSRGFAAEKIPSLLAPLARIVAGREREGFTMSVPAMRSILEGVGARLHDSRRSASLLSALVLLAGVLAALWAALQGARNAAALTLVLALGGTMLLMVLGLQARLAQSQALEALEDFLASRAYLPSRLPGGEDALPAYLQALLEQTAESLAETQRLMAKREEERVAAQGALARLTERLAELSDQLRAEQKVIMALSKNQLDLQPALADLATLGEHVRSADAALTRLVDEVAGAREQVPSAMRQEIKLLARAVSGLGLRAGER